LPALPVAPLAICAKTEQNATRLRLQLALVRFLTG
jgi:hypothetical protein